ncbi:hypothetical protein JWS13_14505 [Rhodococcus pseudokoreensis]|uniref:VanZ like family protein n=1 Tax=Rhodococcus pseudokoreensis TaxID=2811421 RepID=A0A974ZTD6_9NOCA|nr:hypothetical protein [Rhodococcus pseudokoreensis]QSE89756.1 hypothetical protein JWS13_14505 [Rhodococcus pseudokoreensis]
MAPLFYPLVFMNFLFAATTLCLARPSHLTAGATVVAAVVWIFGNGPLEGAILWRLNSAHGLTVSDLLSALALGIAMWGFREAGAWKPSPKRRRRLLNRRY